MVTEDYVSFEIAKLLKEKGFDSVCHSHYYPFHYPDGSIKYEKDMGAQKGTKTWYNVYSLKNLPKDHYLAPTLQMAMKWLREVHNIHITMEVENNGNYIGYLYHTTGVNIQGWDRRLSKTSYEEACEAAIKYCLENLV